MPPTPLYNPQNEDAAYQLRYSWTGWPSAGRFTTQPLAVMPDHLHAALRGTIKEAPADLVFAYQNNLAHMLGQGRIWNDGFYVGSFGEYTTHAVRDVARGTE